MTHLSDDRLIDLAAGLLSEADAAPLLDHLRSCGECESRFRDVCSEFERPRPAAARSRRIPVWAAVAAAAAVLAAVAIVPLLRRDQTAAPDAYWVPVTPGAAEVRSLAEGGDARIAEATEAYGRRDAARVVALLKDRALPDSEVRLLFASALLKTGDAPAAIAALDALQIGTLPQPDRDRAKWIRLAALHAAAREDEAATLAHEMAERPGEFQKAARKIVEASAAR